MPDVDQQMHAGELVQENPHTLVARRRPECFAGTVLDVGARGDALKNAAPQSRVTATDLYYVRESVSVVSDVQRGLPFKDRSFDTVAAMEVLEHIDRPALAFAEVTRVAKSWCVISLPNLYHLQYRLAVLRGNPISGKYWLTPETARGEADRHRWFAPPDHLQRFVEHEAALNGFQLYDWCWIVGRPSRPAMKLITAGALRFQRGGTLFASSAVYYLNRR